jgi:hypothetical protein
VFRIDPAQVGWRIVDGCALIVRRSGGPLYRLNPAATALWLACTSARANLETGALPPPAPPLGEDADAILAFVESLEREQLIAGRAEALPGLRSGHARPLLRPVSDIAELTAALRVHPAVLSRAVGQGFVVCGPNDAAITLSGHAASAWRRLLRGPATFAELLDALDDTDVANADDLASALLLLDRHQLMTGLDGLARFARSKSVTGSGTARDSTVRSVGSLAAMISGQASPEQRRLGAGPSFREPLRPPDHVAIVCQYGIAGLAPGVDAYVKRCIARLEALDADLVIVSGGGRHGLADVREAESVVARYVHQLPGRGIWLENYSATTWENVQKSLEMLMVRSIRPRRISLVGDRARTEKLRLCCWLARRRFAAFRGVRFRVVPVARARSTWRDSRAVQLGVGCAQVIREARHAAPALPMDAA